MSIEKLLQPGNIGTLELKNRVIYSGMNLRSTDGEGHMSQSAIESLVYHAEHGPGLVEFPVIYAWTVPGAPHGLTLSLGDDSFIPPLKATVARVHAAGAKATLQLYARGTRTKAGAEVVGPSAMKFGFETGGTRELTVEEIHQFVEWFGDAALRGKKADFDAVSIHACTGKLISMFISPYSNHRTDEYGGSTENRARFLIEVLQNIKKKCGQDYPVYIRLGVDDLFEQGLKLEEGIKVAQLVEPYVDAIQVSAGTQEHMENISVCYYYKHGYLLPFTKAVCEATSTKIIAMGKLGEPALAEKIIEEGIADFVILGRPLLCDPLWLEKAARGEEADIVRCIGCLNCFNYDQHTEIVPTQVACTVNPGLGREREYETMPQTETPKNILVIGGGVAGIQAATDLARRGHHVTLAERSDQLGGQWLVASHAPHKHEYRVLIPQMQRALEKTDAKVLLNTTVDKAFLQAHRPDEVVLATGALPKWLPADCTEKGPRVVQANDVIMDQVETGDEVVVIGARYIGMEVAWKLGAMGKKVSIVDQGPFAQKTSSRIKGLYRNKMVENGVYMYPECPVLSINDYGVNISHMNSLLTLKCDTVVLAIGTTPLRELAPVLEELAIPYHAIGDAKRIGDALYAIRDGAELARRI